MLTSRHLVLSTLVLGLSAAAACSSDSPASSDPDGESGSSDESGSSGGSGRSGSTSGSKSGSSGSKSGNSGSTSGSKSGSSGGTSGGSGSKSGSSGSTSGSSGAAGKSGSSGSTSGSSGAAGKSGSSGSTSVSGPPGYFTSKDWHGCSWTSAGTAGKAVTTIVPADFTAKAADAGYCIKGSVAPDPAYESVALAGFNVNEAPPETCANKTPSADDVPASVTPTGDGLAINFVKRGTDTTFTLRVQIQGPNGGKDGEAGAADRWCATLTETQGKMFVPYSSFTPKCWEETAALKGTPYKGQPISAVVFLVPGAPTATPYDFCVNGFAYGTSVADAPDGPEKPGAQEGTVGTTVSPDGDFARAKVTVDGENYIIQNNNWGNPTGTNLILKYKDASFKITDGTGSGGAGQGVPSSFPSIYIGNNGNTANGVYSTKTTDNLPIKISDIGTITSTFRYSGSTSNWNATYDIWFAKSIPTTEYQDGIDGFVMIWLRDPPGAQPIGTKESATVKIGGRDWNVWVGPRGPGPNGTTSNAPVVSFTNPKEGDDSLSQSFVDQNLKEFFTAAASRGISADMYLTDVFAGFEIWQGGAGGNLSVDEFKAVVTKK